MFHQWNGRLSKSYLSTISTLVFLYTAVFLLLTHCCGGQSLMVGPSKPILAMLGEDIILPCHLQPATGVVNKTLEWARLDLKPRFVHVRRDGVELLLNQNPLYVGRTTLSTDKLKHGDMSLKLSKVGLTDGGTYKCLIPALGTSEVELVVGAISSHVVIIADIDKAINRLILQCESKGWYPEPEVVWLDGEGNLLSAGPTETVRGPDDLYTVSSRVTVEKRHSNIFTCRVQQKDINQTRDNEIQIRDDVFMAPSCSAVRIIVVLSVGVLLFSAAFFVFWKLQQNKGNNKMHHDNKTEDGTAEREQLVRGSTEMEDLDEEKLKKKDEEEKDLIYVISVLMEQKTELRIARDKLISQLKELEEKRLKTEKKQQNSTVLHKKSNHSQKYKIEIDNMKTTLQSTVDRFNKTEDVVKRITERMNKVKKQIEQIKKQLEETKRRRVDIQLQSEQIERKEETNENPDSFDTESTSPGGDTQDKHNNS